MKDINVVRPLIPSYEEYIDIIKPIFSSGAFTNNGVLVRELESKLCNYLGVKNISIVSSGHMALSSVIRAMELKGEVITTPYTFVSTTHAIVENGLTPVFCDVKDDFTIDEDKIEDLITDKTCAIVPVHVYGYPCNVKKIEEIAKKHNLKVIYDAAHCFGVELDGKSILEYGDASIMSFHATKVYNTIEGGAIVTKDKALKEKLDVFRNFGLNSDGEALMVATNVKMDEFRAAMGLCNLNYVDEAINNRKKAVECYISRLKDIDGITIYDYKDSVKYNYAYFPILVDNRDKLFDILKDNHIFCKKYYYPIVTEMACYKYLDHFKVEKSIELSNKVLVLPLYGDLSLEEVNTICDIIIDNIKK